jgi:uncharacterized protein (DUF433 family)
LNWKDHITADPEILVGKPTIKGTRISVELLLGWFASGWSHEDILQNYPHISREQVLAAMAFAAEVMREQRSSAIELIRQVQRSTRCDGQ